MNKNNFKPFDKVLVRDDDDEKWMLNMFSHYDETVRKFHFFCLAGCFANCIPYEGNEHLLGTTDSPQPKRWRAEGNECYWYMGNNGVCYEVRDTRDKYDDARYNIGNYFRTEEEAQAMADRFKAILKGE